MNNLLKKGTLAIFVATAASFSMQSAKAGEVITAFLEPVVVSSRTTTTTTTSRDSYSSLPAGPGMLVTNTSGQQLMIPTRVNPNQVLFVTTGATIIGFTTCAPDDLITRRDDLLARVFAEKAMGKLTGEQANSLIAEIENAYAERLSLSSGDESDVAHVKGVKRMYRHFDRISNDILKDSRQGNKQLAGKYNYVVL